MEKNFLKNKRKVRKIILFVEKTHFFIYLITLSMGFLSSIAILLIGWYFENAIINYFLSLTASLVITPLFAYMIDVANSKSHKDELAEKRKLLLNPLINNIAAMIGRTLIIWNYEDSQDKEISYANFESCIDVLLDKYIVCIQQLSQQDRNIRLLNECFNIKQWEEYGIREIEKQLRTFLDNQINLISENIFSQNDYYYFNLLYNSVEKARLPYLSMVQDKNISKATVDWPQRPLSDIDISNLHSSFKFFVSTLKSVVTNIADFNSLKEFSIKPDEIKTAVAN